MTDVITQLGELAFASRLRRLSERLLRDASRIYHAQRVEFEARWFPVLYLLQRDAPLAVTDVARALGITHPAVNQIARAMSAKGLLVTGKDRRDDRKRLLSLSAKGRRMVGALQPVWAAIEGATREVLHSTGDDVLGCLDRIEHALDEQEMYDRVMGRLKSMYYDAVEILPYQPRLKKHFRELNLEWLKKYFTVEPRDEKVLSDPHGQIIKKGGSVLFARLDGEVVGTVALLRVDEKTVELAKMAVAARAQGRQIGKRLAVAALDEARRQGATAIVLHTSPKLTAAGALYREMGFTRQTSGPTASEFKRHTITMKLDL
jgi:DNA-binding MarR family transcriptional regulator/ribosomal protein S18 acetylase RimI-like enzyme